MTDKKDNKPSVEDIARAAGLKDMPSENAGSAPFWFESKAVNEEFVALICHATKNETGSICMATVRRGAIAGSPDVEQAFLALAKAIGEHMISILSGGKATTEMVFHYADGTPTQ